MSAKGSVQDGYLKGLVEKAPIIRVSLINGKELRGRLKGFDAFTILMTVNTSDILIYKSAIAAMGPTPDSE